MESSFKSPHGKIGVLVPVEIPPTTDAFSDLPRDHHHPIYREHLAFKGSVVRIYDVEDVRFVHDIHIDVRENVRSVRHLEGELTTFSATGTFHPQALDLTGRKELSEIRKRIVRALIVGHQDLDETRRELTNNAVHGFADSPS